MRFIEASLIMPLTMLVISALIALMMTYSSDLQTQIKKHEEERKEIYKISETVGIRVYDRIAHETKKQSDE